MTREEIIHDIYGLREHVQRRFGVQSRTGAAVTRLLEAALYERRLFEEEESARTGGTYDTEEFIEAHACGRMADAEALRNGRF